MWKMQVEKESKSVALEKEDALNRERWRVGVGEIAVRGVNPATPIYGPVINLDQNWMMTTLEQGSRGPTFTVFLIQVFVDFVHKKYITIQKIVHK